MSILLFGEPIAELDEAAYTRRTTEQVRAMVGRHPELGDIVASGIEPFEPVGRIVAFYASKGDALSARSVECATPRRAHVVVSMFDGNVRTGALGIGFVGYCPRDEWDGPRPNGLSEILWRKP